MKRSRLFRRRYAATSDSTPLPAGSTRALAELLDLAGRSVLVTGGGGGDLGSMLCRGLAAQGANGTELSVGGGQSA
jgi:hypothetical protein